MTAGCRGTWGTAYTICSNILYFASKNWRNTDKYRDADWD